MGTFAIWFAFFIALVRTMGWVTLHVNAAIYALGRQEDEPTLIPGDSWFSLGTTALAWTIFGFGILSCR